MFTSGGSTIADNYPGICSGFVLLRRQMGLLGGERRHRRQQIEESVARYLSQLDAADR